MVALLDQVGEVVDAAREAVPVRAVLPGGGLMLLLLLLVVLVVVVVEVVLMMGGGGTGGVKEVVVLLVLVVVPGTRAEAREQALARVGTRVGTRVGAWALSAVACTLEVERGVDGCGSGRVPDQLGGREGVSYGKGQATAAILRAEREVLLVF